MKEITFITGNSAKAEQLGRHLDYPILHQKLDLDEIQSLDLEEVATHKVMEAYKRIHKPVLVEDAALTFHALGKLPGPFIKWFLRELGNEGLCRLLDRYSDRSALGEVIFALYDGNSLHLFKGEMPGTIADQPKGEKGMGWDPVFIPQGYSKTWAQMGTEEQNKTYMRRKALKKLEAYFQRKEALLHLDGQ